MKLIFNYFTFFIFIFLILFIKKVEAETQRVAVGETITIGEFIYDDEYVATTTPCTISIYDSDDVLKVNEASMTSLSNGWHYYDYTIPLIGPEGYWPTTITCGSALAGDLIKGDKTFIVKPALATQNDIANATSSIITAVNTNTDIVVENASSSLASGLPGSIWGYSTRTLSSFGTLVSDITTAVWSAGSRTLTGFGTLVADVWSAGSRTLTGAGLTSGSLATLSDVQNASSSLAAAITSVKTKTDTIDWADVDSLVTSSGAIQAKTDTINWSDVSAIKTKTDTIAWADVSAIKTQTDTIVWGDVSTIKTNVATLIGEVGTGNISAIKTQTDTIDWTDIDSLITSNGQIKAKTDTIAWADVSAIKTKTDTISWSDVTGIKTQTDTIVWGDVTDLNTALANASSTIGNNVLAVKAKTDTINWSDITNLPANVATAVWSAGSRTLTGFGTLTSDLASAVWSVQTSGLTDVGSIGKLLVTNIDAQISTVGGGSLSVADIWSYGTRTLTSFTLSPQSPWTVNISDFGTINNGDTYMATITTVYDGTLTDSANLPVVTVYDPSRNIVVNNVAITRIGVGTYRYSYTTASNAPSGVWESIFSTTVETGKTLSGNDYWNVVSSPAQVIINSVSGTTPNAVANLTVTNEGLAGYEYQYEWCVVSDINNSCGGGDDVYHGTGAKFINPGEDWNTNLTATVTNPGNYYFKVLVYFGIEKSGSSRTFTIANPTTPPSGGGGGGGGGSSVSTNNSICTGADFNHDKKVNSIDFSILLAFWKTPAPFKNSCVDINKDKQVNSIDFSILLSQWGTKGKAL